MKKALSILLTAALLLTCLAGCGGAGSASPSGTDASGTSQSTAGANVPALKGPGNVTLKRLGYNVAWDPTTDIMVDVLKETTGYDVEYGSAPERPYPRRRYKSTGKAAEAALYFPASAHPP